MKSLPPSKWAAVAIFAGTLVISLWAMTVHLSKPLLGPHAFRQTQTAMSSYYMAQDATMFADYITPVLGKPWRIPMELPIYQWIVARWHNLTGMSLDASGKLVSALAWLACMAPAWLLLKTLRFSHPQILLALALLLSSPLYLFWGAAFLIESTGVFFALSMVACVVRGWEARRVPWMMAGLLCGVLAIMSKATTWVPAVGVGGLLLIERGLQSSALPTIWSTSASASPLRAFVRRDAAMFIGASLCLVLPIIPGKLWLSYGDSVKAENPIASEMLLASSSNQARWNYGTWEQKLDPATWAVIWRHITDQLLVPLPKSGPWFMVLVLIGGAIAAPKRIPLMLALLSGFLVGPLVFTNLYFEHSYYWMANGLWLLMAVAAALVNISEFRTGARWPVITALTVTVVIVSAGFVTWYQRFLPILRSLPTHAQIVESWTVPVQRAVPPGRTMLLVGADWNPCPLYYAERRGIAFPTFDRLPFPGPQLRESLSLLSEDEKLAAIVVAEHLINDANRDLLAALFRELKMDSTGTRTPFGVMFSDSSAMSGSR